MNLTSASRVLFFFPCLLKRDRMARVGWVGSFPPPRGRLALTRAGYFPSPSSDNTLAGQALVKQLLRRRGLVKKDRLLWCIEKWFPSPCRNHKGLFFFFSSSSLDIYYEDSVENLELNLTKFWRSPPCWVPGVFCTKVPSIHQLPFRFSHLGPPGGCSVQVSALWCSVFACLSLPCVISSPMNPNREVHFSICAAFFDVMRMEWQLSSSYVWSQRPEIQ